MKARAQGAEKRRRTQNRKPKQIPLTDFAKGQVWKTSEAYILITEVGKLLIHYRLGTKPEMHATPARLSTKGEVQSYLERNKAVLVKNQG